MPTDPLRALLDALDLTRRSDDCYEGHCVERLRPRTFGGELIAQSLVAAARTAVGRECIALHVTFAAPGRPTSPVEYRVRRVRDGRRFAQRMVSASQNGRELLLRDRILLVRPLRGQAPGSGPREYQHEAMPEVRGPEGLASELEQRRAVAELIRPEDRPWLLEPRAVEVRQVRPVALIDPEPDGARRAHVAQGDRSASRRSRASTPPCSPTRPTPPCSTSRAIPTA